MKKQEKYTPEIYPSNGKKYNGEPAIISLTSWKARINTVPKTIFSLLQYCSEFHIVLVLSAEEFPQMTKELPEELMLFVNNNLIEILWVYKNYKAFKKVIFTMDKYRDVPVISADDDCIYKCNYAKILYNAWLKNKNAFVSPYISIINGIPHTGGAATLYPPYVFKEYGLLIFLKSKIWEITNQDDDFYTALKTKLNLTEYTQAGHWRTFYTFHDECNPLHNELKISKKERLKLMAKTIKYINDIEL